MLVLLFFLLPLSVAVGEETKPAPDLTLAEVRAFVRRMAVPATPGLTKHLKTHVGSNFTLAFNSASSQGPERGVLFGKNAALIFGAPAHGNALEGVEDRNGDLVNFKMNLDAHAKEGNHTLTERPASCIRCHGKTFTYIWPEYKNDALHKTWRGFLGEADDRADPESEPFMKLTASPNFAPLFSEKPRSAFPYWQLKAVDPAVLKAENPKFKDGGVFNGEKLIPPKDKVFSFAERKIDNLPNARLGALLTARAGRSLAQRIKKSHPARYNKYKYSLLHFLECGPYYGTPDLKEVEKWTPLLADFERDMPARAKQWKAALEAYQKDKDSYWVTNEKTQGPVRRERIIYPLMLLDYLGVAPESILLTEPLPDNPPLSDPKDFITFLKKYRGETPLEFESGINHSLHKFIPAHLEDIDLKVYKANTELKANPYGYLAEEPILKTLETTKEVCPDLKTAVIESMKIDLSTAAKAPVEKKPTLPPSH